MARTGNSRESLCSIRVVDVGFQTSEAAVVGTGDTAGAGVGVGEAFVSSARAVAPLAEIRTTAAPIRVSKRIFWTQFIVWIAI